LNPFASEQEILLHEQSHSFEFNIKNKYPKQWLAFRKDFSPENIYDWEEFAEGHIRIRRFGVRTEKDRKIDKFVKGQYK